MDVDKIAESILRGDISFEQAAAGILTGKPVIVDVSHTIGVVTNEELENGWGEHCPACGWCDTPGRCIASTTCPTCGAGPKTLCRDPQNPARLSKYHDARWALVEPTTEEVSMSGQPDPKGGTAVAEPKQEQPKAETPKAEKKGLDKGYIKLVVARVEKGLKYSEIEQEFVKAERAIPDGFKTHYPAIRKAAIDHFGSVQKVNETRGRAKLAAAEAEGK